MYAFASVFYRFRENRLPLCSFVCDFIYEVYFIKDYPSLRFLPREVTKLFLFYLYINNLQCSFHKKNKNKKNNKYIYRYNETEGVFWRDFGGWGGWLVGHVAIFIIIHMLI